MGGDHKNLPDRISLLLNRNRAYQNHKAQRGDEMSWILEEHVDSIII